MGAALLVAASPASAQVRTGALGTGGGGTVAGGPSGPRLVWQAREFQMGVVGPDVATDIAHWIDPNTQIAYVFMTGYQTTASGATVMATFKYLADGDGHPKNTRVAEAFYPPDPQFAIGTNKGVAMAIDPTDGKVFLTGEVNGGTTAQDYVTIAYDQDLNPLTSGWSAPSFYNNALANGDDVPVDIAFTSGSNVVAVTGRSAGAGTGDDIQTLLYDAGSGALSGFWPSGGGQGTGARRHDGGAFLDDTPVGVGLL